jgi:hypothetical protein
MRVKIGEKDYIVSFTTETFASVKVNQPAKELHQVICRIYNYEPQTKKKNWLTEGTATQNYKDKTNDVLGRKIAFTRALNSEFNAENNPYPFCFFPKEERITFWNEYKRTARYIVK